MIKLHFQYHAASMKVIGPRFVPGDSVNGLLYHSEYGYSHVVAVEGAAEVSATEKIKDGLKNNPKPNFTEGDILYFVRNSALADKELFLHYFKQFDVDGDPSVMTLEETPFESPMKK